MPIYEYVCKSCGHEREAIQKISDAALTDCPECKAPELVKKISAPGFRLSGTGWYETDFKGGKKKNLKENSAASGASSSADTAASSSTSA